MNDRPTVYVADDDPAALKSLEWLLESVGLDVNANASPQALFDQYDPHIPGCIVLDIRMPEMSGLEVQERLNALGCRHPVIFVTAHGDVPACSRAFKAGAFEFLEKPVNHHSLLDVVQRAIDVDAQRRSSAASMTAVERRRRLLTTREAEVLELMLDGKSIKQIASDLAVTFQTAARHRASVLHKMDAENDAVLVRKMLVSPTL